MGASRGRLEGHRAARSGTDQNPRANNRTQAFFNVGVGFLVNTLAARIVLPRFPKFPFFP
jgi:hypothetical protein